MSHLTPSSQSCLPNTHKELECLSFPRCLIPDNRVWLSEQGPSPHKDTHVSTQKLWIHCITWKLTLLIYWPWDEKMTSIWGWFVLTQYNHKFSSVQLLSRVQIFATPWIAARQASLSITNSWSSLRLTSTESVIPSSHLILCRPLLLLPQSLPASESSPMSQLLAWGGWSTGISASTSVLPMNSQDWSPLEWTSWISLQSKGLSRVFSNTTGQKHQFFGAQLSSQSNSHIHTWLLAKP